MKKYKNPEVEVIRLEELARIDTLNASENVNPNIVEIPGSTEDTGM